MAKWIALLLVPAMANVATAQTPDETFFELKVRPVLAGTCFRCHGGEKTSGKLRVDSRDALLRGGDNGPAVVPGQPDRSLLVQALRHAGEVKMPPGKKLPDAAVADIAEWVKRGAVWPAKVQTFASAKHWAFQPVKKAEPPADPSGWAETAVDRFIAARLRAEGLKPVGPAERGALLRRVTFDLIGLPPTPEEIEAFERAASAKPQAAYAEAVERLLASPLYGERWGRHWLDVARYADTGGDNADYPIPEVALYRDYVIDAFNADLPYDRFVREQIAGDILAKPGPDYAKQVAATGFLALSRRYATAPYELWHLSLEDAIDTVGQAFLGLTMRCARCHDHKFDPVSSADYYGLYGILASTQFPFAGAEEFASMQKYREHFVPLIPTGEAAPKMKAYADHAAKMKAEIATLEKAKAEPKRDAELNRLRTELRNLLRPGVPGDLPAAYAVSEGKAADAYIHKAGDPEAKGPVVKRCAPQFLGGDLAIPPGQSGRLQFAEWLTRPDNPLPARVMVNRIWQHHFGKGIVGTPNNLGIRGEEPTHPELLDYLAARFIEKGWSVKAIHREILLSRTYRMASTHDETNAAKDPGNRWSWRHDRRRLDAEAIRDSVLSVSGNLDRRRPGPHPFPPMSAWGWTQHNPFKDVYPSRHRSVYLMTQRLQRHPFLALFDGPDTNTTTEKRPSSTVPQQALFLMNNPWLRGEADALAKRLRGLPAEARVRQAHLLLYGRPARPEEAERGQSYVARYAEELRRTGAAPEQAEAEAWLSYARVLLCANEFVYVD